MLNKKLTDEELSNISGGTGAAFGAFIQSDLCVGCGACEDECPEGLISRCGDFYVISSGSCIGCGACAAICPINAIRLN